MDFTKIISDINERKFSPVYFLEGDENYFIDEISDLLERSVISEEEKVFNLFTLYGRDVSAMNVADAATRYPAMAERQVVILKEAQSLKDIASLAAYIEDPVETTVLVVNYRGKKVDKRSRLGKALSNSSLVHFTSKRIYDNQVPSWITRYIKGAGMNIDMKSATLIADSIGNDLKRVVNELDKLVLTLPKGAKIGTKIIEDKIGISKEYNSFELQDAVANRDILKATKIINYFGANPVKYPLTTIVSSLFVFFKRVLIFHYSKDKARPALAKSLGVHEYFLQSYDRASRGYDIRKCVEIIGLLREFDLKSKGLGTGSSESGDLLKELIFRLF